MQRVLSHLHSEGVTHQAMQDVMRQLPLTPGMDSLLQQLQTGAVAPNAPCSCIILSDR
jgi:hypothetical protein